MFKLMLAALLLVAISGCAPASNCGSYADEASCAADTACHWNKNEGACKS